MELFDVISQMERDGDWDWLIERLTEGRNTEKKRPPERHRPNPVKGKLLVAQCTPTPQSLSREAPWGW